MAERYGRKGGSQFTDFTDMDLQPEGAQTGLAADSTGIKYTSQRYRLLDAELVSGIQTAYIEASKTSSAGDETVTVELYDETVGSVVGSITITGASNYTRGPINIGTARQGNQVSVRWNVTSASATSGATFDATSASLVIKS